MTYVFQYSYTKTFNEYYIVSGKVKIKILSHFFQTVYFGKLNLVYGYYAFCLGSMCYLISVDSVGPLENYNIKLVVFPFESIISNGKNI